MSRYSRPGPAPSTNPFGQAAPPYQAGPPPFQPSVQQPTRPASGFGFVPNANATPPPSAPGYATGATQPAATGYPPPPAWDGYQQPKPWETAVQPPPQANPWEGQHQHRQSWDGQHQPPPTSQWDASNQQKQQQPQDNLPGQWDNQYQPWDQTSVTYPPPATQVQSHHYGGGLDELASPINPPKDNSQQQPWYDNQPVTSPLPTTNTGTGGFTAQTSAAQPPNHTYFSSPPPTQTTPSKPQDPQQQYPYPPQYSQQQQQQQQQPPPPPSQAPPAIPFDHKPPYPVGKGQPFYSQPRPPATYNPQQGQGDKYSSLRSLSAASNHEGSSTGWAREEEGKADGSGDGGYYGVPT